MTNRDWFWILLGILGLMLVFYLCSWGGRTASMPAGAAAPAITSAPAVVPAPAPASPPPATVVSAPPPPPAAPPALPVSAQLGARFGEGKVFLSGTVPDESVRTRIVDYAKASYGGDRVVDQLAIDPKVAELRWLGTDAVFAPFLVKDVTSGQATFNGNAVVLTGEVVSGAIKARIGEAVQRQVGALVTVDNQLRIAAAAVQKMKLDALLKGRTIEFETGSAVITARGRKVLDETVPVMQEESGTRVEVAGHTDNVGGAPDNMRLSDTRAQAVLGYLVAKGVDRTRLSAKGYGQEKPIADNTTVEGRARNRRIDFDMQEGGK